MIKNVILAMIVVASAAFAQYAPATGGASVLSGELNSKPASQSGAGVPTGNCTAGKDVWLDTTGHQLYFCSQTNTWALLLSGTALPNGTTATTQTVGDNTTKVATTAFVIANAGGGGGGTTTVNGVACTIGSSCTVADATKVPTTLIPTTAPSAGEILVGQSGGTYTKQAISGSCTLSQAGVMTCSGSGGGTIIVNGVSCTTGSSCTVADATKVPTTLTINGHALSANLSLTATDIGLGAVTNDVQTKASIVPNTVPAAGKLLVGNAGGTAYAPVSVSGSCTMSSLGVFTCSGGSSVLNDFVTATVSSSVVEVAGGTFRYGTNLATIPAPIDFTMQTGVAIASIVTSTTITTINTATPLTHLVDGQSVNVQMTGCAGGTGVFVATANTSTSFFVNANTSACTFSAGTVGASTGGYAIIFGNSAGQIEMSHSAAMGALVSVSGTGGVVSQTSTGTFPNGAVPIAYVTVVAGDFNTVTDYRAVLDGIQVQSGSGIDVTMVGGQPQVSVASNVPLVDQPSSWVNSVDMGNATKTVPWRLGTGSPNARDNCTKIGEAYFRTDAPSLWNCTVTGTPGTWAVITGSSGSSIYPTAPPTAGQILAGNAGGTAYANVTPGGDLTVSSAGVFSLLSKFKVWMQPITLFDPTTSDSGRVQFELPWDGTMTGITCSVEAGTSVSINLDKRATATPNTSGTSALSTPLVCDTDSQTTTTFASAGITADTPVALIVTAVSGTPGGVRVFVKGTVN